MTIPGPAVPAIGTTAEHVALADSVRALGERVGLRAAAREAADSPADRLPDCWPALAAAGLLAAAADGTVLDVGVIAEALGEQLAPGPWLPTMAAGHLVARHGGSALTSWATAGLEAGTLAFGVAVGDRALAAREGAVGMLASGTIPLVLGGAEVTDVILPVDTRGGRTWYVVPSSELDITSSAAMDPTRHMARVSALDLHLEDWRSLSGLGDEDVEDVLTSLIAAEAAGIARWCRSTAVAHAGTREQFGSPIGAFQAVKHTCADMLCREVEAQACAWDAAMSFDDGATPGERRLAVAVAASAASRAAVANAKACIQILGGLGYTWEHDAHLYLRRACALRQLADPVTWEIRSALLAADGVRRAPTVTVDDASTDLRRRVQAFLAGLPDMAPADRRTAVAGSGFLVPSWPPPYGIGASPVEQLVVDEEFVRAGIERSDLVIGNWVGPTVMRWGTEAQIERFVGPTVRGEIRWCQMFSEPEAGSDLAALHTRAVRVEAGWALTGQKLWTSDAGEADWAICLARTGAPGSRHRGITYFLVDMTSPGLEVRPLRDLTGDALFNEVFLTEVFVPDDCVVGEVDGGWQLVRTTLDNERVSMTASGMFPLAVEDLLDRLRQGSERESSVTLARVGSVVCRSQADTLLGIRTTMAQISGTEPGTVTNVRKLLGMYLRQDSAELAMELSGPTGVLDGVVEGSATHRFIANRSLTIAGGTSEILRDVIGERILGLPRLQRG